MDSTLLVDEVLRLQQDTLACLERHVPRDGTVVLLDFPRHQNAGDSLIWHGEQTYLRQLGADVRYTGDLHCFDPADIRRRVGDGTILITGGGNFGDRWIEHQQHRLNVFKAFPDNKIVQLPQSIDFSEDQAILATAEAINHHGGITLLMRDRQAAARAKELFPGATVEFCPDMALGVGLLGRLGEPVVDTMLLLRQDCEGITVQPELREPGSTETHDWGLRGRTSYQYNLLRLPENVARVLPPLERLLRPAISSSLESIAALNVREARRLLSRGKVVITDRLHAMLLAALCGIPVVAMDNANGKVKKIYDDYINRLPGIYFAENLDQALATAEDLL